MPDDVQAPPLVSALPDGESAAITPPVEVLTPPNEKPWTVVPATALDKPPEPERDFKALFERNLEESLKSAPQTKEGKAALAKLVTISRRLSDAESPTLYRQAYLATLAFAADREKSDLALTIVEDLEFTSSRSSPIYIVMRGLCLFIVSLVGALTTVSTAITLLKFDLLWWLFTYVHAGPAVVAGLFGVLGSIVSILLRLSDFAETKRKSRDFLLMTGMCLPIVGLVFAWVTAALFSSHLINFAMSGAPETADYGISFYVVIGFLSGFSERFTKGLLGTTENSLVPTRGAKEGAAHGESRPKVSLAPSS